MFIVFSFLGILNQTFLELSVNSRIGIGFCIRRYTQASESLRKSRKIKAPDTDLDSQESGLKTLLRANTTMTSTDWITMSDSLSDHLVTIAERYRQELT
jgi:hypothetical protein